MSFQNSGKEKLVTYRFYILALFSLLNWFNGLIWISMSPIASKVKSAYGVEDFEVNLVVLMYLILFLPGVALATFVYERFGLRNGVILGATLQGIGSAMKYFISVNFYFVLGGQALAGLAQPIYLSSPALMAASWFGVKERTIAITIGGTFNAIGNMIGFFLPTIFVDPNALDDELRTQIRNSLLVQGIAGIFLMLLAIFTFKNRPESPPGPNNASDRDPNLFGNLLKLITDFEFVKLMIIFTMYVNTTNVFGTLIDKIVEKYNFNTDDSGFFGTINVAWGIVSWFLFGYFLNKTEMFKSSLITIGITLAGAFVALMFALKTENKVYVTLAYGFVGITTSPLLVVWLTFWSKITYPINEATAGGLLQVPVQYFSFGISFLISDLIDMFDGDKGIFWMFMLLILITLIGVFFSSILKKTLLKSESNEFNSSTQSIEESENSLTTKNYETMKAN